MTTHWTRFVPTSQHSISISLTTGYHMLNCLLVTPAPTSFTSTTIQIIGWNATITPSKASCDHHRCLLEHLFSDYSNSSVFVQSPCCTVKCEWRQKVKTTTTDVVLCQYERHLSQFAWQRVAEQYRKSTSINGRIVDNGDGSISFGHVNATSCSCSCQTHTSFDLPCKHIFFVRKHQALPGYDLALCNTRWVCGNVASCEVTPNSTASLNIASDASDVPVTTRGQRYKKLMTVFNSMAAVLCDLPQARFQKCQQWLSALENSVRDGSWEISVSATSSREPAVNSCATQTLSASTTASTAEAISAAVDCAELSCTVVADAQLVTDTAHADDHDGNTVHVVGSPKPVGRARRKGQPTAQPSSVSSAATEVEDDGASAPSFTLPRRVKQRGRPVQSKQRTFRAKVAAMQTRTVPPGTKTPDDNCIECGLPEPPRHISRDPVVDWVMCDVCQFWTHVCCQKQQAVADTSYVCDRCTG